MATQSDSNSAAEAPSGLWRKALGERGDIQAGALRELAATYWYCIYAWWRRAGLDPVSTATATIASFDRWLGDSPPCPDDAGASRMRDWILARLPELAEQGVKLVGEPSITIDRSWAERRYAEEPEGDPGAIFQRRWALSVIETATSMLRDEYSARGEQKLHSELLSFAGFEQSDTDRYSSVAQRLGQTAGAIRRAVFDFRNRQREILHRLVADTVLDPADADSEITALLCACDATGTETAGAPLPAALQGLRPDEILVRAMRSVKMTHDGSGIWQPPTIAETGLLFPQYEIVALIGRGGMGAVYKGRQVELDRPVAIKLLPLEVSIDPDFADRFRREARAMAKLQHPNIILIHEFGTTFEGHLFFVMEFVEGADLHQMIHGPGVTPEQSLSIISGVCDALAYAHGKGVVHRDIKPANVMVSVYGEVKVADFGLARLLDPGSEQYGHTVTGTVMGTPDYMAPEQMRGMNVDHRADIYSLGVMLYEMLCKEVPRGIFDPPSVRVPGVDAGIDQVVIRAMQQQPDRRYQSTTEMKTDVAVAAGPKPAVNKPPKPAVAPKPLVPPQAAAPAKAPPAKAPQAPPKPAAPPRKRVPMRKSDKLIYAGIAAVVLVLLGVFSLMGKGKPKEAPQAAEVGEPEVIGKRINLLPLVDVKRDKVTGTWFISGGVLRSDNTPAAKIKLPYHPPEEYDLRVAFTRVEGNAAVVQIITGGGRQFQFDCDGWSEDHSYGFGVIGTLNTNQNYTTFGGKALQNGRKYSSVIQVRRSGTKAWLDGKLISELKGGDYPIMTTHHLASIPDKSALGLLSNQSSTIFHSVEVFEVTGTGRIIASASESVAGSPSPAPAPNPSPSAMAAATTKLAPPSDALSFGGHRYHYQACRKGTVSWPDAKAAAERFGGRLAVLETREEFEWVVDTFGPRLVKQYDSFWIGGSAQSNVTGWRWVSGSAVAAALWKAPQPDVGKNAEQGDFPAYLNIHKASTSEFNLNDSSDTAANHRHWRNEITGYLVEWDSAGAPQAKQTIDLLALTDPEKDRVQSSMGGANVWKKLGGVLSYETDGKAGKIASPVGLLAKAYEIEVAFRRKAVGDRFHIDLPISDKVIVPLAFGQTKNKIVLGTVTIGTSDPLASSLSGRVAVRVEPATGNASKVTTWFEGNQIGEWAGNLASIAKNANEPHPEFPGQPITTLWCAKDGYEFTSWKLRVFEGEAKVLREPTPAPTTSVASSKANPWVVYPPATGMDKRRHIVFLSGDEEYRSEESLPMLAKILSQRHGFKCTVLFAVDANGHISPDVLTSLPGAEALDSADLIIMLTRFRAWPDAEMKRFADAYLRGVPIIGLRTATHAFKPAAGSSHASFLKFGENVLGAGWVNHWGAHKKEATLGIIEPTAKADPILNGVADIFGNSDVYEVKLPPDVKVLVRGQVLTGMNRNDPPANYNKAQQNINNPMMPVAWTRTHRNPSGRTNAVFCTTMGAATDFESEGLRRLVVNAAYSLLGLEVPAKADVGYIGEYRPTMYSFNGYKKGVKPSDLALSAPSTSAPVPVPPKQTIDLLALTDPVKDRVNAPAFTGANNWSRGAGGSLVYRTDGKAGKLMPPVAINARSYELEVSYRRLEQNGQFHLDLPLDATPTTAPLLFDKAGKKLLDNKFGDPWPNSLPGSGTLIVRCDTAADGKSRVAIRRDGVTLTDWTGNLRDFGKKTESHPAFAGQLLTTVFCMRDSYEFTKWELRIFEGEAKVLRNPSTEVTTDGSWLDVIPQVQLPRDFNQRQPGRKDAVWQVENGVLKAEQSGDCGIVSPDLVLPDSYDLSFRVKAAIPDDGTWRSATVHVPVGENRHLTVHLGLNYPPSKINATVFEQIGGKAAETGSPSIKPMALKTDVEQLVEIAVRRDGGSSASVDFKLDGKPLLNWSGKPEELTLHYTWNRMKARRLGLSAHNAKIAYREVRFRAVEAGAAQSSPPASSTGATKDSPFVNSLGMKFVPVPITGGPTDGKLVLFSVWDTRVQDYEKFANETKRKWLKPAFEQGPDHPAVMVSLEDAKAFCEWLTLREGAAGKIGKDEEYRLPSDHEWSCAVGIGDREDAALTPDAKNGIIAAFPAGSWPPAKGTGNFPGEETEAIPVKSFSQYEFREVIPGYRDDFVYTSPVGKFPAERHGLHDMSGNVMQWCGDWYDDKKVKGVIRGIHWNPFHGGWKKEVRFRVSFRNSVYPGPGGYHDVGFRCVLVSSASATSPPASPSSASPTTATKDSPFTNSLGMKFVPVPITGWPLDGQKILFSVWETRVRDYETFVKETKRKWPKPNFEQSPDHPAVMVSWDDAKAFCEWLTLRERAAGKLGPDGQYRLPSDHEWSCAVGIGDKEDPLKDPKEKNDKIPNIYPWGSAWPPPKDAGNYHPDFRDDGFPNTSPVGSFAANPAGLYDMSGNVSEWCEDLIDAAKNHRVLRGFYWHTSMTGAIPMLSSRRFNNPQGFASFATGFRIVLQP